MTVTELRLTLESREGQTWVTLTEEPSGEIVCEAKSAPLDVKRLRTRYFANLEKSPLTPSRSASLGKELARIAFPSAVGRVIADRLQENVRLWLDLRDSALREAPWEFLWTEFFDGMPFVSHPHASLLRGTPGSPVLRFPPGRGLRVLVASADPKSASFPHLPSAAGEMRSVLAAFSSRECHQLEVEALPHAHRNSFLDTIRAFKPDIVHFIGHGARVSTGGCLVLEGSEGEHEFLYAEDLAHTIRDAGARLVSLSGCFTAGDISSVGEVLTDHGVAAVLGMQSVIRDSTARLFARAMYSALAEGDFVDQAVQQGRAAIRGCEHEWGIPVLFIGKGVAEPAPATSRIRERLNYLTDPRPFVGRKRQRFDLWQKLRDPSVRLVTVFGMGGMGKTRLLKQIGEDLQLEYLNGVRLIECDVLQGPDEILGSIAKAAEIERFDGVEDLATQLADASYLFLIDCFERHVSHRALLETILERAPRVDMLVSSRVVLGGAWEHAYELEELGSSKEIARSERVELFVQAARQADGKFDSKSHRKTIVALVDLLQGVPIALLLAAAKLRHMGIEQLYERLQTRLLDTLRHPSESRLRHRDIRIIIEDSFELLSPAERLLAIQLSVFAGGFTLEDAERVLGNEQQIQLGIESLHDQSLLTGRANEGLKRYATLDTVREYLGEAAGNSDLSGVRLRHAELFANRSVGVRELFDRGDQAQAGQRLWQDIGNFRAALRSAKESGHAELIVILSRSLARPFLEAGILSDFELMSREAESIAQAHEDWPLLIEIRGLQGTMLWRQGRVEDAERFWLERAALCARAGDIAAEADSYLDVANTSLKDGRIEVTREMLANFHRVEPSLPNGHLRASGYLAEAQLCLHRSNVKEALSWAEKAEAQLTEDDATGRFALYVWFSLAQLYKAAGRFGDSIGYCNQIIKHSIVGGFAHNACTALLLLAEVLIAAELSPVALMAAISARRIAKAAAQPMLAGAEKLVNNLERQKVTLPGGVDDWIHRKGPWQEITADVLARIEPMAISMR